MFNEFLSAEEGKQRMQHSIEEAELYKLQQQAGHKDFGMASWILVLVILLAGIAIMVL